LAQHRTVKLFVLALGWKQGSAASLFAGVACETRPRPCSTFRIRRRSPYLILFVRAARRVRMGCLVVIIFLAFPRIALAVLFFFSNYIERAYHGLIVPLLGFIFLPLTTLVYAWIVNSHLPVAGLNLILLIIAVVIDLGSIGHGASRRRRD
jgi:hypothetical protein